MRPSCRLSVSVLSKTSVGPRSQIFLSSFVESQPIQDEDLSTGTGASTTDASLVSTREVNVS